MTEIPTGWGRVTGTLLRTVQIGDEPTPVAGAHVRLRARAPRIVEGSVLYASDTVECTTDDRGQLLGPDGTLGALVLASDGDSRPDRFTWRVTVSAPTVAAQSWDVLVVEGETTDLFTAATVPGDLGRTILEWERAREDALGAIRETADEARRSLVSFTATDTPGVVEARFPVDAVTDDPNIVSILIGDAG